MGVVEAARLSIGNATSSSFGLVGGAEIGISAGSGKSIPFRFCLATHDALPLPITTLVLATLVLAILATMATFSNFFFRPAAKGAKYQGLEN